MDSGFETLQAFENQEVCVVVIHKPTNQFTAKARIPMERVSDYVQQSVEVYSQEATVPYDEFVVTIVNQFQEYACVHSLTNFFDQYGDSHNADNRE
jgi:hypothetical protein